MLANCVLAQDCGGQQGGRASDIVMSPGNYDPPEGMSAEENHSAIKEVLNILEQRKPIGSWKSPDSGPEELVALQAAVDSLNSKGLIMDKALSPSTTRTAPVVSGRAVSPSKVRPSELSSKDEKEKQKIIEEIIRKQQNYG